ncbi:CapA family protein [Thiocystis violascens]|uniref:Bacterial capsule synthesis protein PGA_cap n=1 Tax=Thiocystis violascens (strain ATCC 17096 / DSM 198 / 6111) TaxID=765911 RepID=I3YFW6_THIV6|nr:CapA family protein [Thiocystis violascens]AFL75884.1 Bacterial capsule synthesis protein PGA_cap [Thiocystis violascens DSM 198]
MSKILRLLALGDLLLCGRYDALADAGQAKGVFNPLLALLNDADIVVGNLECPLTASDDPRADKLCLRGDPRYADVMAAVGVDVLSLANNHLFDHGLAGFRDTDRALTDAGIAALGAGATLEDASRPRILERDGQRIGFLAYCHDSTRPSDFATADRFGVAPLEAPAVLADVRRWRGEVDHLILLLHWGLEYSPLPTPEQVQLAHAAVDAGVGLILGHHSHMIQGIETYRGAVIAYSLGNCTDSDVDWQGPTRGFEARMTQTDREGLALTVELGAEGVRLVARHPLWLNDAGQPEPATGARAEAILAQLDQRSQALDDPDLTRHWENALVAKRVLGPLQYWWSQGSLWDKIRRFRLSQFKTLYLLVATFVRIRLSRSEARWSLFNPRNDTRPMPYGGGEEEDARQ